MSCIKRLVERLKGEGFAKTFLWEVAMVASVTLGFYNIDWLTDVTSIVFRAIPFEMTLERALILGLTVVFWVLVTFSLIASMGALVSSLHKRLKGALRH